MSGYLELTAKSMASERFEVALHIFNVEDEPLIAIWRVELPTGLEEVHGRHVLRGRTVAQPHSRVDAEKWEVTVLSSDAYLYCQLVASATVNFPASHFRDSLSATLAQIRLA
ncbi:MAG: hypothetical protein ACLGXA_09590 [Acidobacteriota bacterium]